MNELASISSMHFKISLQLNHFKSSGGQPSSHLSTPDSPISHFVSHQNHEEYYEKVSNEGFNHFHICHDTKKGERAFSA